MKFLKPLLAVFVALLVEACGTATVKGYDCPLAAQLRAGSTLTCGGKNIVGTLVGDDLPACGASRSLDCIASAAYPAVDGSRLVPENIRKGKTLSGVMGVLTTTVVGGSFSLCDSDGAKNCIVADDFVAVDTQTLPTRIALGSLAGGVTGVGDRKPAADCTSNAQVGCVSNATYTAYNQTKVSACLVSEP